MASHEDDAAAAACHKLTRRDVAARLSISVSSVRRMEFVRLHPLLDSDGVWRFDPKELEGMTPRPNHRPEGVRDRCAEEERSRARRGRVAAKVFRMFARGVSLPQIVVVMKQPPGLVRELYHEWSTSLNEGEWERRRMHEGL